jgi:hypothetical protein
MPNPYNQEFKPTVGIPQGDSHALTNLIISEWVARRTLLHRGSYDTLVESGQHLANVNSLLDHYPDGRSRDIWAGHLLTEASDERAVAA